jgi:hypothetical protein
MCSCFSSVPADTLLLYLLHKDNVAHVTPSGKSLCLPGEAGPQTHEACLLDWGCVHIRNAWTKVRLAQETFRVSAAKNLT